MGRRGAVLAGNRAVGARNYNGLPAMVGDGASPLARDLATGMGVATNGAPSWGNVYGTPNLPRPAEDFTDGAFGPFTPTPAVPVDTVDPDTGKPYPRREEYRVGWNLPVGQPGTEGLKLADFNTLRTIADLYSVARACIEFLKNQITSLEWEILPTKDAAKAMRNSKVAAQDFGRRRAQAVKFFRRPDPDYFSWQSWLGDVLEEMLVYDALSVVIREKWGKGRGRGVLGSDLDCLNLVSGPTIRPLYDMEGARPRPPAVGYQQYLYGVPRVDLWSMVTERDLVESGLSDAQFRAFGGTQLLYLPATRRRWTPYGFPPVERALVPIMSGLQRQAYQLDYFREGTIPGVFISPGGANADITPNQIRELQDALNAIAGDPAWKHKIIVLPADSRVDPMRPAGIADQFDELVMTQTCIGFGLQPMQLGIMPKMSGTASSGAHNQMAKMTNDQQDRTSVQPKVIFLATLMDYLLQEVMGQDDMRFLFDGQEEEEDEETKTNLLINQITHGLATIDEGRDELGKQPFGVPKTSDPGWGTATGFQTFTEMEQQAAQQQEMQQQQLATMRQGGALGPGGPTQPGQPSGKPGPGGGKPGAPGKPGKPAGGGTGATPGHASSQGADTANASKPANQGTTSGGTTKPTTKAAGTATADADTQDDAATDDVQPQDSNAIRDAIVAAAVIAVAATLVAIAKRYRRGEMSLNNAVSQGLYALADGYQKVMARAGREARAAGLTTTADLTSLDLSGLVSRRAEAQRQFLVHALNQAGASDDTNWLPSRMNLYGASLYGAYNEGYGAAVQATHPEYKLIWRLGEAEHCPLCLARNGQEFTFDTLPGWPGDGGFGGPGALCLGGQNCRCHLDYAENGEVIDEGGNQLEQAGYYSQQAQDIGQWRHDVADATDAFLDSIPNPLSQQRAQLREDLRRQLADLLNQRTQALGGYGGISYEPADIPAAMIAQFVPQYGPIPADVPVTALMDAVDQFFAIKGAALDLTKTELAGIVLGVVADVAKVGPKGYEHGWVFVGVPGEGDHGDHDDAVKRVSGMGGLGRGEKSGPFGDFTANVNRANAENSKTAWGKMSDEDRAAARQTIMKSANGDLKVNMSLDTLEKMLGEGRLKTLKEIDAEGVSPKSSQYLESRVALEKLTMGYHDEVPAHEWPIYGTADSGTAAAGYGEIRVHFKDEVRDRTSATLGDSLNDMLSPLPLNRLASGDFTDDELAAASRNWNLASGAHPNQFSDPKSGNPWADYMETQIHGGLSLDDVKHVELSPYRTELGDRLKAKGIHVVYV